ncbi:hypothetical protein SAMN06275492_101299 [Dethiosulfovibrio salsuginis]|uniref:Uncharacterized protein n=1 Tax=Dethiosulfovibrio salsuginis TaxID=561720 RepID=A0A1X7IBN9_9BACT|nr:hypothetical protein SAMN06275492_101299 [Dethiosulfovibrio salsuginis]
MKRKTLELNGVSNKLESRGFNIETLLRYIFVILYTIGKLALGMILLVAFLAHSFASGKDWR